MLYFHIYNYRLHRLICIYQKFLYIQLLLSNFYNFNKKYTFININLQVHQESYRNHTNN